MRVKSPEEMIKALENCAEMGPCTNCPYNDTLLCLREIGRDAAEIIRQFKETTERTAKASEWISVTDRLPETSNKIIYNGELFLESDPVAVVGKTNDGENHAGCAVYTGTGGGWYGATVDDYDVDYLKVTHWAPIPALPEGGAEE